jgi:hypothetical protein
MKKAILGLVLLAGTTVFAGCGLIFVARGSSYAQRSTPAYCYDCHSLPAGVIYDRCNHYEIRVAHGGYYYRPYRHGRHEEYIYVKLSGSNHNENYRADQNREKSKRGRR